MARSKKFQCECGAPNYYRRDCREKGAERHEAASTAVAHVDYDLNFTGVVVFEAVAANA